MRVRSYSAIRSFLLGTDWVLVLSVLTLAAFGLAAIYSIDLGRGLGFGQTKTQVFALVLGLVLMFALSRVPKSAWRSYSLLAYVLGVLVLLYVVLFGVEIRGTRGWIIFAGFSFQPVEFMKVGMVLFMAYLIERSGRAFATFTFFSKTALYAVVPVLLVLLQPDLGSAITLFVVWLGLVLMVGIKRRYVLLLAVGLVVVAVLGWLFVLQGYQKDRIMTFIDPNRDPLGAGYNVQQSIIAVGSGRVFGRGLGQGSQTQLRFLPEAQTDFIFSVIAEELGFIGVSVVFIAFIALWYRLIRIALAAKDDFGLFVVLGATMLIFGEVGINVGATLGSMPVTGIALPFVSAGGSSLLLHLILIGILLSVHRSAGVQEHQYVEPV